MSLETAERIVAWSRGQDWIRTVDLTGGSPEMNPAFRWLVESFRDMGHEVIDRCNPTIILHRERDGRDYEWVPAFLAEHRVRVVASLPCYLQENVERQRGRGAYDASVEGLRRLNAVGYGTDPTLPLMLVFNPTGPSLPPPQESLEDDYRRELKDRFDLVFTGLWTIANMPIARWRHELERDGRLGAYLDLLVGSFNPGTIDGLMCRRQVNVDPCGRIFDCDFNQAIDLGAHGLEGRFVWEFDHDDLAARTIATGDHCYGCTAGAGSSCGGALA